MFFFAIDEAKRTQEKILKSGVCIENNYTCISAGSIAVIANHLILEQNIFEFSTAEPFWHPL